MIPTERATLWRTIWILFFAFIIAIAMAFLLAELKDRNIRKAEENFSKEYAILNDSFVLYKKDMEGRIHAETKSNYVTADQLELLNKQHHDEIKAIVGNMKNFVSNLKVTVEYPARKDSGITHFDSLTRRITLDTIDNECLTITSFVDSLKIGHTNWKVKPSEYEFTTFWKEGKLFRPDTLVTDGQIKKGCEGLIVKQKQITVPPPKKHTVEKPGVLVGVGAAIGIVLFKIFGL